MRNRTPHKARTQAPLAVAAKLLDGLQATVDRVGQNEVFDQAQLDETCRGLIALARTTRAAGLSTYCSLSLHVLEQLKSMIQGHYISTQVMNVLRTWITSSAKYLRKPRDLASAAELVGNLGDRQWERPVGAAHRAVLLSGLNDDWVRIELNATLGPHVRALRSCVL